MRPLIPSAVRLMFLLLFHIQEYAQSNEPPQIIVSVHQIIEPPPQLSSDKWSWGTSASLFMLFRVMNTVSLRQASTVCLVASVFRLGKCVVRYSIEFEGFSGALV